MFSPSGAEEKRISILQLGESCCVHTLPLPFYLPTDKICRELRQPVFVTETEISSEPKAVGAKACLAQAQEWAGWQSGRPGEWPGDLWTLFMLCQRHCFLAKALSRAVCPGLCVQALRLSLLWPFWQALCLLQLFWGSHRALLPWNFVTRSILTWGLSSFQDGFLVFDGFIHSLLRCWSLNNGNHRARDGGGGDKCFLGCQTVAVRSTSSSHVLVGRGGMGQRCCLSRSETRPHQWVKHIGQGKWFLPCLLYKVVMRIKWNPRYESHLHVVKGYVNTVLPLLFLYHLALLLN